MAFKLFGYSFTKEPKENLISFVPEDLNDGSSIIAAGGSMGYYVDLDGTIRSDIELIKRYREMSLHAEIELAIDDIINEAIADDAAGKYVSLDLDKTNLPPIIRQIVIEEFDRILNLLNFNRYGRELFRKWYIDGRLYYHKILGDDPSEGIKELRQIDPLYIKKVREVKKNDQTLGVPVVEQVDEYYVFSAFEKANAYDTQGLKISVDSISYCHSGLYDAQSKRIVGYLHKAIKPLNQLRMIEDATVIYRISRAPERRVFYIDVGSLPKNKAEQYLRDIMNKFRNKVVYDAATGEVRDDRKHMHMLEDFWLPRREGGRGTQIETLPAGQNLGEMEDVLYFQKKLWRALNIPMTRMEAENGFNMGRTSEITRDELKFSKFISGLRLKFSDFFLDLLRTQLLAKQVMSQEDWDSIEQKIGFVYSTDSYFTESKQAEIMKDRLAMLRDAADFVGKYFSERWVRKNILRQTEDDIDEMNAEIEIDRQKELERQQQEMALQAEQQAQMQQQQMGTGPEGQEQAPPGEATATSATLGDIVFDASSLL